MIAASPLPGAAIAFCILFIGYAMWSQATDPEGCGVDACGMAMMFGTILLFWAVCIYLISLLPAFLATKLAR